MSPGIFSTLIRIQARVLHRASSLDGRKRGVSASTVAADLVPAIADQGDDASVPSRGDGRRRYGRDPAHGETSEGFRRELLGLRWQDRETRDPVKLPDQDSNLD